MTNTTNDQLAALYPTLNALWDEVPKLREAFAHGPLDGVLEAHYKLVSTLIDLREVAHDLAELEPDNNRATALLLLDSQMTSEILRLTQLPASAQAAAAGCEGR
jgi:hypothetical protein